MTSPRRCWIPAISTHQAQREERGAGAAVDQTHNETHFAIRNAVPTSKAIAAARGAAIEGVEDRGQIGEATAMLLEAMKSNDGTVRQSSCQAIGLIGDSSEKVMIALRARLRDESIEVRAWAADALIDLGEPTETVVPSMIEGLRRREAKLPKGEDRIQGICCYLSVPDRYHAARILASLGAWVSLVS